MADLVAAGGRSASSDSSTNTCSGFGSTAGLDGAATGLAFRDASDCAVMPAVGSVGSSAGAAVSSSSLVDFGFFSISAANHFLVTVTIAGVPSGLSWDWPDGGAYDREVGAAEGGEVGEFTDGFETAGAATTDDPFEPVPEVADDVGPPCNDMPCRSSAFCWAARMTSKRAVEFLRLAIRDLPFVCAMP